MSNSQVAILGYGAFGRALATFFDDPYIEDAALDLRIPYVGERAVDVLHVCSPYDASFEDKIVKFIRDLKVPLTIIHSTVCIGTTERIAKQVELDTFTHRVVHSPIRGLDASLSRELAAYDKLIGADDSISSAEAFDHLESVGIPCKRMHGSKVTEWVKSMDVLYRSMCISLLDYADKLARETGDYSGSLIASALAEFNRVLQLTCEINDVLEGEKVKSLLLGETSIISDDFNLRNRLLEGLEGLNSVFSFNTP